MQIELSDRQPANADAPIRESLEPDSKITLARSRHCENDFAHNILTDGGIEIDKRREQEQNAELLIRESVEPGSNETLERICEEAKHFDQRDSTVDGIQSERS
jgi:hypothetical protein